MTGVRPKRDDHGFTILEMTISMAIMSIVMVVVIGAISQIYSATNRVDTESYDRTQATVAFRRLDAAMRYATWLAKPGLVGTRYYVEYAIPNSCQQLKFDTAAGVLTLYSWAPTGNTPANPVALASNLTLTSGLPPFFTNAVGAPYPSASTDTTLIGKAYTPQFVQLRLRFSAVTGPTTMPFDTIFTAENTTASAQAATNLCSNGRPTT